MVPDVSKEVEKIAGEVVGVTDDQGIKLKDKRVGKSDFVKAAEKFLEVDISEIKRRAKQDAKRKALRAIGEILSGLINITFNAPPKPTSSGGTVIRQGDNVSYKAYNQISSNTSQPAKTNRLEFADLIYDTWDAAEELKAAAQSELARRGGKLSVSELYDIFGDASHLEMTDGLIGWHDLSAAYVGIDNGKYRVFMPQVESLR